MIAVCLVAVVLVVEHCTVERYPQEASYNCLEPEQVVVAHSLDHMVVETGMVLEEEHFVSVVVDTVDNLKINIFLKINQIMFYLKARVKSKVKININSIKKVMFSIQSVLHFTVTL